ncbi:MAG: hypothetical protein ACKO01_08230 [Erythrobacter sp.]
MGWDSQPEPGTYIGQLADHARRLQAEARAAFERGDYTRASSLLGDAELLAEDVHDMVAAMERREIGDLATLLAYDLRVEPAPAPPRKPRRLPLSPRALKLSIAASLTISLALTEF